MVSSSQASHIKQLEEVHDQDVAALKKVMDSQVREHMKQLAKKHKNKELLSRSGQNLYLLCVFSYRGIWGES